MGKCAYEWWWRLEKPHKRTSLFCVRKCDEAASCLLNISLISCIFSPRLLNQSDCSWISFLIFLLDNNWVPCLGVCLSRPWRSVHSGAHVSWGLTCTPRPPMEAGGGWWPWPSSWWRPSPTAPSRALASSSRTWWRSMERPTAGCPGSSPSACLSWLLMVSVAQEQSLIDLVDHDQCLPDLCWSPGPLSSALTNRFGFQLVVMVGGFLISSGTIATSFTTSVNQMYLTYGVVAGIVTLCSMDFRSFWSWIRVLNTYIFSAVQVWATVWPSCPLWPSSLITSPADGLWS